MVDLKGLYTEHYHRVKAKEQSDRANQPDHPDQFTLETQRFLDKIGPMKVTEFSESVFKHCGSVSLIGFADF